MKRATIWVPTWEEVAGAAANMARRNLWRVRPLFEHSDLMSEAYLVFMRLVRRYPRVIDPPHFMALFLRSWVRTIHSMASRRTRSASGHVSVGGFNQAADGDLDPIAGLEERCPRWQQHDLFWSRAENAPEAVRALLDGIDRSGRPRRCAKKINGQRETTNSFLCRIAQLDPAVTDMRKELSVFLESASV